MHPTGCRAVDFQFDATTDGIFGWPVMSSKTTVLLTSVLVQVLFTRRCAEFWFTATGLVYHSDVGGQYTSIAFTEALREAGIARSIGSVGDALDNALMESAVGLYKLELIDSRPMTRNLSGQPALRRGLLAGDPLVPELRLPHPAGDRHLDRAE